ncbi:hypothetical protein [Nostoc sp.]|uniref:hypothetical protein n=1 Tax=Nostoc sp. TaxID=1180 RepID=UPI002FF74851
MSSSLPQTKNIFDDFCPGSSSKNALVSLKSHTLAGCLLRFAIAIAIVNYEALNIRYLFSLL